MPQVSLTSQRVKEAECPPSKRRVDLFDTALKGFVLEVRATGGKTYYIRYTDHHGRQKQHKIGDAAVLTLDEARREARRIKSLATLGYSPSEGRKKNPVPTFGNFVEDRYIPYIKGYKRSWRTDEGNIRIHLMPRWRNTPLNEIRPIDIIEMHQTLVKEGYAPSSANRILILLRYIFNLALRWEVEGVEKNPTAKIPLFEENNKIERYLSERELSRLADAISTSASPMLPFIIRFLILTGARKSEALTAKWEEIDVTKRLWRIPLSKSGKARFVPLSDGALELLREIPRPVGCKYIFTNPRTGNRYKQINFQWDVVRRRAGIPDVRIHDLRHSFASFLVNSGRSLYEVQKILGHAKISTTERYAHLSNQSLIDAANAAADIVKRSMI